MSGPLVVIGVGNVLLRDDGIGPRIVEALGWLANDDASLLPAQTRLLDGGTLGMDLLDEINGACAVLVVDALDTGGEPGTVRVLRDDAIGAAPRRSGSAAGGIAELLAVARLLASMTGPVALVGVEAGEITFELGLSPRVKAALPLAIATVRRTAWALADEARGTTVSAHHGSATPTLTAATA
ncbi:MAG: hydrogenase maturation protease [Candidatus Limnocylindrales bacterium]